MRAAIRFSSQNLPRLSRFIKEKTNTQILPNQLHIRSRMNTSVLSINNTNIKKYPSLSPMSQSSQLRTIMIPVGDHEEFDLKTIDQPVPEDKKILKLEKKYLILLSNKNYIPANEQKF